MTEITTDIAVIGGGPSGLTAAMYAARAGAKVVLIEEMMPGGQVSLTDRIENYPGFPGGIEGPELAMRMAEQVRTLGVEFTTGRVMKLVPGEKDFTVKLSSGQVTATAVVVASGSRPQRLGVSGEDRYIGRGISFCATCDGPLYRGRDVVVAGGGDAAAEESLFLARFARSVKLIHRRDKLRAIKVLADRVLAEPRIEVMWNTIVVGVVGDEQMRGVETKNVTDGTKKVVSCDGMFIYVGSEPNSGFLPPEVATDERGYVITDERMQTSLKGVFAAGDVRTTVLRQVATSVGDGAIAGTSAEKYALGE